MPNTPPNFECHITIQATSNDLAPLEQFVESFPGWSFSRIAGDPVLGHQTFCYATAHFNRRELALFQTITMSALLEREYTVVRRKVEEVVWDSRKYQGAWN